MQDPKGDFPKVHTQKYVYLEDILEKFDLNDEETKDLISEASTVTFGDDAEVYIHGHLLRNILDNPFVPLNDYLNKLFKDGIQILIHRG